MVFVKLKFLPRQRCSCVGIFDRPDCLATMSTPPQVLRMFVCLYLCICVLFMSSFCYCVLPFFVDGPTVYYLWITILTCFPLDLCYDTKWFWWKQIVKLYKRWKLIWICLTSGGGKMPQNVRDHRASDLCIKKCTFILTYFQCCSDLSWNYFKPLMFYSQF